MIAIFKWWISCGFLGKKILDSVIMILATENLGFLKGMMVKYLAMIRLGKVIYYLVSLF
jgi:hypothetical protein